MSKNQLILLILCFEVFAGIRSGEVVADSTMRNLGLALEPSSDIELLDERVVARVVFQDGAVSIVSCAFSGECETLFHDHSQSNLLRGLRASDRMVAFIWNGGTSRFWRWFVYEFETQTLRNTGLATGSQFCGCGCNRRDYSPAVIFDQWLAIPAWEAQRQDLNDDGDEDDSHLLHLYDLKEDRVTDLNVETCNSIAFLGGHLLYKPRDCGGSVIQALSLESGEAEAVNTFRSFCGDGERLRVHESGWMAAASSDGATLHLIHFPSGEDRDVGVPGWSPCFLSGRWAVFPGDSEDDGFVYSIERDQLTPLGLNGAEIGGSLRGNQLLYSLNERDEEQDFNGDSDLDDPALFLRDLETGESIYVGEATSVVRSDEWLALQIAERHRGRDLNADGDMKDLVLHAYSVESRSLRSLGIAGSPVRLRGDTLVFTVHELSQQSDYNGDGDREDEVVHLVDLDVWFSQTLFRRGDCNDDGAVDISDAVFSLGSLFLGDAVPGCDDACDSNDDGLVDISDAITMLGVLFLGNGVIPFPGMTECGVDFTDDPIGCSSFARCP